MLKHVTFAQLRKSASITGPVTANLNSEWSVNFQFPDFSEKSEGQA